VLLVNVPIVIGALIFGFRLIPDSRDPGAPGIDVPGAVLSISGLAILLWGLIEGPEKGWTSGLVLGAFALGIALLVGFLAWERHTDEPMLDVDFFKRPRFSAASGAITFTFMALMGTIFILTQYLQSVHGFSPLKAGAVLIPMSGVMMVLAPTSARIVERVGTKLVLGVGLIIVSTALFSMSLFTVHTGIGWIIAATMLMASGMANVMAPATESIMGSLPREKAGVGSAVNDTTRQVGGAIGVALIGSLLASRYGSGVDSGLADAGLEPGLLGRISNSIQEGVRIGGTTDGDLGGRIIGVAQDSFMNGMHLGMRVAAGITLVAAVGVFLWLPARAPAPDIPAPLPGEPTTGNGNGDRDRLDDSPIGATT
jgi:Na+/melibiose symporter-like transporter